MNEIDAKIYMSSDQGFFNQCDSFKGLVLRDVLEKLPEKYRY